jgi:hypothetical protein
MTPRIPGDTTAWLCRQSRVIWSPVEKFTCKSGKNREIGGNRPNFMKTAAQCCRNFKALRDEFPGMSIREILRSSREVTGSQFSRYRESL